MMENRLNCKVGDWVTLDRETVPVKKDGLRAYEYQESGRYVCVQERGKVRRGILVKVLGSCAADELLMVNGEPFCKDDKTEGFYSDFYYGFRFPAEMELQEVLRLLRDDAILRERLRAAGLKIDPADGFWIRETRRNLLGFRCPQYYDGLQERVFKSGCRSEKHCRIAIAYF